MELDNPVSNSSFFLPYFNLYVYDITNSVRVRMMTSAERSAYFILLCEAWKQPDCGLPNDDETLAELSLARSEWEVTSKSVRAMFKVRGDRIYNERLLHEREKLTATRGGNSKGGMRSGNTRRKKKLPHEVTSKSLQSDYEVTMKYTDTDTDTEQPPNPLEGGMKESPTLKESLPVQEPSRMPQETLAPQGTAVAIPGGLISQPAPRTVAGKAKRKMSTLSPLTVAQQSADPN